MEIDLREEDHSSVYRIMTSLVVPRPIGWISTRNTDGRENIAPYSYFNGVSGDPPVVMFSGSTDDGGMKDSPAFAIESGAFCANLVTEALIEEMDATSAGIDGDEFEFAGLETVEGTAVPAPRVADAAACFECELYDTLQVYDNTVVFGEVIYIHVDESLARNGEVDAREVDAVGRLGGPFYTRVDVMDFTRQY